MENIALGKPTDDDNDQSRSSVRTEVQHPPMFKLNIDCLHKVFDYLSLEDVHSLCQTCKSLQQVAGHFFQQEYVIESHWYASTETEIKYPIYSNANRSMNGFDSFTQNLFIKIDPTSKSKLLKNLPRDLNRELKEVRCRWADFTLDDIQHFNGIFKNIECLIIEYCKANREFCEELPKMISNLKRLYVRDLNIYNGFDVKLENDLLLHKYPRMEHLHWSLTRWGVPIYELERFFRTNPKVRSLGIDIESLHASKGIFIKSNIKLDDLTVEVSKHYYESYHLKDFTPLFATVKELYEQGVYKRLHINLFRFDLQIIRRMAPLQAVKSLYLDDFYDGEVDEDYVIDLPELPNLIQLKVSECCELNLELLTNHSVKLEQVHFQTLDVNGLLQFILKIIKVDHLSDGNDYNNTLDLFALNEARKQLIEASKVIIYIDEEVYLATKWAMDGTEFNLAEIRRGSSYEFGDRYLLSWV